MAPECFIGQPFAPKPLDIWALGVTIYGYVTSKLPFFAEKESDLEEQIR